MHDVERRLAAKAHNESLKTTASIVGNIGTAAIILAFFEPVVSSTASDVQWFWFIVGTLICIAATQVFGWLRSEE